MSELHNLIVNSLVLDLRDKDGYRNHHLANQIIVKETNVRYFIKPESSLKKIRAKVYKILLRLIDDDSSKRLKEIDKQIKMIANYIKKESGWIMDSRDSFIYIEEIKCEKNPKIKLRNRYHISRNKKGFYNQDKSDDLHFGYRLKAIKVQDGFINRFSTQLNDLHELLLEKENILSDGCKVNNPEDIYLVNHMIIYLGYNPVIKLSKTLRKRK